MSFRMSGSPRFQSWQRVTYFQMSSSLLCFFFTVIYLTCICSLVRDHGASTQKNITIQTLDPTGYPVRAPIPCPRPPKAAQASVAQSSVLQRAKGGLGSPISPRGDGSRVLVWNLTECRVGTGVCPRASEKRQNQRTWGWAL